MRKYPAIAAAIAVVFFLQSCTKDNISEYSASGGNCSDTISFQQKIMPLINQNCTTTGCHGPGSTTGYEFTSHGTIAANANLMLNAMRHESGVAPMPQGMPQLPDSLIQQFACWIDQGKQNN